MITSPTDVPQTCQIYQVLIKTTPQQIWAALTKPEFTRRYFHGVLVDTTAEVGTPFRQTSADGARLVIDETVLESDPPRRLVVSWRALYDPDLAAEPASRVSWDIEDRGDGVCLLTTTHDRLEQSPRTAGHVGGLGWTTVLSGLKTLLETGDPLFPAA